MFGSGVLKGLGVTLTEFINTYVDDLKRIPSRYAGGRKELNQIDTASAQTGLFTIQYPEERRKLSERFRYIPMLVYDVETGKDRCTACGICAKVCPTQCIWIVRAKDERGKPVSRPAEFHIDVSICMNCGLCAEFCPFDSIKMNQNYEVAAYERMPHLIFGLEDLRVPSTYYAEVHPTAWAAEEAAKAAKEAKKKAAAAARAAKAKAKANQAAQTGKPAAARPKRTPEEIERLKAEAAARRAAKAAKGGEAGKPAARPKRTPEEIERLKAEAAARRAAKAAGEKNQEK